jgi:hypothetical protein
MQMADEINAGQERGEVATADRHPGSVRASDTAPATLDNLGVTRRRLSEWRDMRDAGVDVVEGAIQARWQHETAIRALPRCPLPGVSRKSWADRQTDATGPN